MGKSGKGKKSSVPVIGEKEYEQYVDFLRRESEVSSSQSQKNGVAKSGYEKVGEEEGKL